MTFYSGKQQEITSKEFFAERERLAEDIEKARANIEEYNIKRRTIQEAIMTVEEYAIPHTLHGLDGMLAGYQRSQETGESHLEFLKEQYEKLIKANGQMSAADYMVMGWNAERAAELAEAENEYSFADPAAIEEEHWLTTAIKAGAMEQYLGNTPHPAEKQEEEPDEDAPIVAAMSESMYEAVEEQCSLDTFMPSNYHPRTVSAMEARNLFKGNGALDLEDDFAQVSDEALIAIHQHHATPERTRGHVAEYLQYVGLI